MVDVCGHSFWEKFEVRWRSDRKRSRRISGCTMDVCNLHSRARGFPASAFRATAVHSQCAENDESRTNYLYRGQGSLCSRHIVHPGWDGWSSAGTGGKF